MKIKRFMYPAKSWLAAALLGCSASIAAAQSNNINTSLNTSLNASLNTSLNESVQFIPKKGLFTIELETTIYKPDGEGPFPIALINHGKQDGDSRFQARSRPTTAARYFLQRGYAVVVPMRQGFSKSGGSYIGSGCNVEGNGRAQADDVKAALDYVTTQPWADKNRMVVLGQSHGGWTTLAFGTQNYPGVKALINFAGGLRQESCVGWQKALARGAKSYAKDTQLPSLWFYGDNDSYFNVETFHAMFDDYTAAGGQARLVAFGQFGADSHSLFGARAGAAIWQPEVSKLLASVGLPSEPQEAFSKFGDEVLRAAAVASGFAPLSDDTKVPFLNDAGRIGYQAYLSKAFPRAFAVAPNGSWGWADGGDEPLARAISNCGKRQSRTDCKLYSVDDLVVWRNE